jgi:4'-phosphopantetheinyl transferase
VGLAKITETIGLPACNVEEVVLLPDSYRIGTALQIKPDEVHVWAVTLPPFEIAGLKHVLSSDELERAARFHHERDRNNFANSRALLRVVLAGYMSDAPYALNFLYNEFGKPRLNSSYESGSLDFNLSHSGNNLRIAVARDRAVGIDIEVVDETVPLESIARTFFSPKEVEALGNLPPQLKRIAFFSCWTRKEAYIKARGSGLSIPLDSFDVSVAPGTITDLIRDDCSSRTWKVENLETNSNYSVSVAGVRRDWKTVNYIFRTTP